MPWGLLLVCGAGDRIHGLAHQGPHSIAGFSPSPVLFTFEFETVFPEIASNSLFSCFSVPTAGITGMCCHSWLWFCSLVPANLPFKNNTVDLSQGLNEAVLPAKLSLETGCWQKSYRSRVSPLFCRARPQGNAAFSPTCCLLPQQSFWLSVSCPEFLG